VYVFYLYRYGFLDGGKIGPYSGVKLCMLVRLLSGMSFSHLGELWLAWTHGGGITSGMYGSTHWCQGRLPARLGGAVRIGGGGVT